jgi:diacylglycerol kinase (ATP)
MLRQALEEGCTRVVAVGGDGTLNRLVNHLAAQKRLPRTEVALIPAGTCNDFARALRLSPKRVREAAEVACSGIPRDIDVGDMNGHFFLNNAGFGRKMNPEGRRAAGPIRTLRAFEAIPLRAVWDKGSITGDFFMGLVCNQPFFSRGLHFTRAMRPDDGLFDVVLVPRMRKAKLAAMVFLGRLGRSLKSRQLLSLRVPSIRFESDRDLWPQADGEPPVRAVRQVNFTLAPWKLRLIFPAGRA